MTTKTLAIAKREAVGTGKLNALRAQGIIPAVIYGPAVEGNINVQVKDADLRYRSIGDGDTVTGQLPAAGVSIAEGTEVILYLGATPSEDMEMVPDLSGMSYQEARDTLSYYGLYIQSVSPVTDGAIQRVSGQSIAAGTLLRHGGIIAVTLISSDESLLGIY